MAVRRSALHFLFVRSENRRRKWSVRAFICFLLWLFLVPGVWFIGGLLIMGGVELGWQGPGIILFLVGGLMAYFVEYAVIVSVVAFTTMLYCLIQK